MKRRFIKNTLLVLLASLWAPCVSYAAFPVTAANINSGTVMAQSPTWPFPQFLEYPYGRSLATINPDGVPHAEMEATLIQVYVEGMRRLQDMGGWKPAGLPHRLLFVGAPTCSEGDGYGLLMAAMMADKDTFDGLWVDTHSYITGVISYENGAIQGAGDTCNTPGLIGWTNTLGSGGATDGDEDACLALLIAWKQWGANSGYTQSNGQPISYKQEFINMSTAFALWRPQPGDTGTPPKYGSAYIGVDGYMKSCNANGEFTAWGQTAHAGYPLLGTFCVSQGVANCSPKGCMSYLAPGYYRCISSALDANGNTQQASQFYRAAVSSEYVIGGLNAQFPPYSIGTDGYGVDDTGAISFGGGAWGSALAEGIRTPFRNGLTYLWYGTPADHWDPIAHQPVAGASTSERDFVDNLSKMMYDPRAQGNAPYNENYGLSFWGFAQWRVGSPWSTGGLMPGAWHIPWGTGPMAIAACGANSMPVTQQYELMMNFYRQLVLVWDKSSDGGTQTNAPAYFHAFYRWAGLQTLTGNFTKPCDMVSQPNLKIYKAVDKTFAYAGDTLTYVLSYRNYGSADAAAVTIVDALPAPLQYLSATGTVASNPGLLANGTVKWSLGTVVGLHNAAGGGTNKTSTMGAVTLVVRVDPAAVNQRICNTAQIFVGTTLHWTSNEYPNEISMTFKRNCVDIISRSLAITKTANPGSVACSSPVTFSIAVTNKSDPALWLNGGRPKVYAGFSSDNSPGYGPIRFYAQLRSESYEPMISPCNYRWSFFFYDDLYGVPGGAGSINQMVFDLDLTHNPNLGLNGNRAFADFFVPPLPQTVPYPDSMVQLPVTPGLECQRGLEPALRFPMVRHPGADQ
jgi:uncharacterized repeat protein (TIGR01451 family)